MTVRNIILFACFLLFFCKKNKNTSVNNTEHPVPVVPVQVTLYPNDPQYAVHLQNPGGWVYLEGAGVQGLIIYRKSMQDFTVLDRASPQNPHSVACRVKVQNDNYTLKDTVNGGRWQIVDGAPLQGSSPWYLRMYASSYDGNKLVIVN